MVSAPINADMSLDDIIKKTKPGRGRGGRGRGGASGRGASNNRGGFKSQTRGSFRGAARGGFRGGRGGARGSFGGRGNFSRGPMNQGIRTQQSQGSTKLNIKNLEFGVNDNDLRELFQEFGMVRNSAIHYDASGRSLGTAHVIFANHGSAARAVQKYNGVHLDGRPMRITVEGATVSTSFGGQRNAVKRLGGGPSVKGTGARGNARGNTRGGRGGKGGRGGRGGAKTPKATPSAADLDAELEAYSKEVAK